jgi:hypothetical protein
MTKKASLLIAAAIVGSISFTTFAPVAYARDRDVAEKNEKRRGGAGGFIRLMCNENGAVRLEKTLTRVDEKLSLSTEQQTLFSDLKTAALTAQTVFSDNCTKPVKQDKPDMIDRMKLRQANMSAHLTAMESVMPELELFFDSLTDAQKKKIRHNRRSHRGNKDKD